MAEKRKRGRPKKIGLYSPAIARELCEKLSEGIPLREICRKPGMPAWQTVYDWMNRYPDLAAAIQNARDIGCDNLAEECLSIADNLRLGTVETVDKDGNLTVKTEDMLGHYYLGLQTTEGAYALLGRRRAGFVRLFRPPVFNQR